MNGVFLSGNLVKDPKVTTTPSGAVKVEFGIANNERYKDKDGQWKDDVSFIGCFCWGPLGEAFARDHRQGSFASIRGKIKQEGWTNKDGKQMSKTQIKMEGYDQVDFRVIQERKRNESDEQPERTAPARQSAKPKAAPGMDDENDNVPF